MIALSYNCSAVGGVAAVIDQANPIAGTVGATVDDMFTRYDGAKSGYETCSGILYYPGPPTLMTQGSNLTVYLKVQNDISSYLTFNVNFFGFNQNMMNLHIIRIPAEAI